MLKSTKEIIDYLWKIHRMVSSIKSQLDMKNEYSGKLVGDRVICRSNEDEPYRVGTIASFQELGRSVPQLFPVVLCEEDNKEYLVMGILEKYSDELAEALDKLTPREQWNVLSSNYKRTKE